MPFDCVPFAILNGTLGTYEPCRLNRDLRLESRTLKLAFVTGIRNVSLESHERTSSRFPCGQKPRKNAVRHGPHPNNMQTRWTTLVEPEELAARLDDATIVVVDCRFALTDPSTGYQDYLQGHIPGARYAHLDSDLSGEIVPGSTGRHPLPTKDRFEQTLSNWGISITDQVVCYDDSGGGVASRLWWMLNWLGHESAAVLNGGWSSWITGEHVVTQSLPDITPSAFRRSPERHPEGQQVLVADDVERIRCNPEWLLLDARDSVRFRGEVEPIDPIAGHIPGAVSVPFKGSLDESGRFLEKYDLRRRFLEAGVPGRADHVATYCGSGVTAAHNILAMKHAGLGMAKLYAGSWSEWITDRSREIAEGND